MNLATVRHVLEQISIPDDSTISRTIYQDDQIKAVLIWFRCWSGAFRTYGGHTGNHALRAG